MPIIPRKPAARPTSEVVFPKEWTRFFDELATSYVKSTYAPDPRWAHKPFGREDVGFFSKGIRQLSELFTDGRPHQLPDYCRDPKNRSSYLLYFLPLQAAKIYALVTSRPLAMQALAAHAETQGRLVLWDLGAGPATASIGTLLALVSNPSIRARIQKLPIEVHLWDINAKILEDGAQLLLLLCDALRFAVPEIHTHVRPWRQSLTQPGKASDSRPGLILMGHVLNEEKSHRTHTAAPGSPGDPLLLSPWIERISHSKKGEGAGILIVEPAFKRSSQLLSAVRDAALESGAVPSNASAFWGPCPHGGRCPLSRGKDWCHFSVRAPVPGKWFKELSRLLSEEREWLKYSYLWISAPTAPAPLPETGMKLVISDSLMRRGSREAMHLLCAPEQPIRIKIAAARNRLHRGDWFRK